MPRTQEWWDNYFLKMAQQVATASKDPSTAVGAVIVDANRRVVSIGYNGFAKGVHDDPEKHTERYTDRNVKLRLTIHAEINAILFAQRSLVGCTLYTHPFQPCAACSAMVIQVGIPRVVAPQISFDLASRWADDIVLAKSQFKEAGVALVIYPAL